MGSLKKRKAVTITISAWWNAEDKKIHVAGKGAQAFVLTIGDDPLKKRGHPKLFRELAKVLREAGMPAPD